MHIHFCRTVESRATYRSSRRTFFGISPRRVLHTLLFDFAEKSPLHLLACYVWQLSRIAPTEYQQVFAVVVG